MVKQILLLTGVAMSLTAFAESNSAPIALQNQKVSAELRSAILNQAPVVAKMNDGSYSAPSKAASTGVQWKRPAGQFWGTGMAIEDPEASYYFTPLVVRPWTEYKFENISTAKGTPNWECEYYDVNTKNYTSMTSADNDVSMTYVRYETPAVPQLTYKGNSTYAQQYYGDKLTGKPIQVLANNDIASVFGGMTMPVSSHYYGAFSRAEGQKGGGALMRYTGAAVYPGMDEEEGHWFGTNNSGINAMATRFEKPDHPYLLNAVYYFYGMGSDVPKDIPMKAYVFKTVNDAAIRQTQSGGTMEVAELGELIAESESFLPAAKFDEEEKTSGFVEFKFIQKNPVTGAENAYSLEVDDDIIVVVTGFNADLGNGGYITSFLSTDPYDEGYGNLGFLGRFEENEDGTVGYNLTALKNFFQSPLHNTVLGVLADVSYPWLHSAYNEQPSEIRLANDGATTEEVQGLSYALMLMSTSQTDDFEVTFDGEEECEWLSITDVYDETETNEAGEEEFTGLTALEFTATPNPSDESRVCHVRISIPAASYDITFLQGSKAENAVDSITVEGVAKYFDLSGRQIVNPEKGVYIKVSGNKAEKVVF